MKNPKNTKNSMSYMPNATVMATRTKKAKWKPRNILRNVGIERYKPFLGRTNIQTTHDPRARGIAHNRYMAINPPNISIRNPIHSIYQLLTKSTIRQIVTTIQSIKFDRWCCYEY